MTRHQGQAPRPLVTNEAGLRSTSATPPLPQVSPENAMNSPYGSLSGPSAGSVVGHKRKAPMPSFDDHDGPSAAVNVRRKISAAPGNINTNTHSPLSARKVAIRSTSGSPRPYAGITLPTSLQSVSRNMAAPSVQAESNHPSAGGNKSPEQQSTEKGETQNKGLDALSTAAASLLHTASRTGV